MEKKRPQLSLDELQQLRWLLGGGLALIAVGSVGYLDVQAGALAALTAAGVLAALVRPDLPARVPARAHQLAFPLIVAWFGCDLYLTAEVLPAMIRLDLLLLLYRGVSYRQKRDDLQIVVLGLFLVMAAGVLTVSLVFALEILGFAAGTLALLFVITLTEAAGGPPGARARVPGAGPGGTARAAAPAWTKFAWRRLAGRWWKVADGRLLALGGALFLGLVAVSALLFLSIPRFQIENSLFLDRLISLKSRTGFSDSIHLGDVVDIQQDNSVALRVDVSDPARVPAAPYWRMVVLDEYHAGEFRTSRRLQNEMVLSAQYTSLVPGTLPPSRDPPVYWTFYFESGVSRHLPLAGPFARLRFQEAQWVQRQTRLRTLALRNEPATMTAYRVEGMQAGGFVPDRQFGVMLRDARAGPAGAGLRLAYPLMTLQLPAGAEDREILRRVVDEIAGGARLSAEEFAARASRWLAAKHGYSLQVTLPPGERDPIVRWLASDLPGHCELFTGAFTLLARAAGFPTRAVTGFRGGDWNGFENYFMVRNSQAHAWCEVYDGAAGWFRVDPTFGAPAAAASEQSPMGGGADGRQPDRSWRARLDALRILWYRRIVSFDQRAQAALLSSLRETAGRVGATLRAAFADATARLENWFRRPWSAPRLVGWLGAAAAGAAATGWWWRQGRPWWWRVRAGWSRGGVDPVRRRAGWWLRRLDERRRSRVQGQPVLKGSSGESPGGGAPSDQDVVMALQRLRYGPRGTWPAPAAVFRRARRALRVLSDRR